MAANGGLRFPGRTSSDNNAAGSSTDGIINLRFKQYFDSNEVPSLRDFANFDMAFFTSTSTEKYSWKRKFAAAIKKYGVKKFTKQEPKWRDLVTRTPSTSSSPQTSSKPSSASSAAKTITSSFKAFVEEQHQNLKAAKWWEEWKEF
ncbi:hypothetical protein BJV82DRAFT_716176 [Fennellomyces sp. T-0311]|nr:hypothetical protein BJV82DRAFT_716176 [Fennellomyces sp. T-0311]